MSGVVDDHQRIVRRDLVQPAQRRLRQSVLQQRVPAVEVGAVGPAPGHLAANGVDDLVGVAHRDRPDVHQPIGQRDRLHQRMAMCLNESRHHAAVADIDGLGVRADESGHLGPVTDRDDPAVGHRQRLGGGPGVVDGQDGSGDDDVCSGHGHEA